MMDDETASGEGSLSPEQMETDKPQREAAGGMQAQEDVRAERDRLAVEVERLKYDVFNARMEAFHRIRNYLQGITGIAELLHEEENSKNALKRICYHTSNLMMIQDLLEDQAQEGAGTPIINARIVERHFYSGRFRWDQDKRLTLDIADITLPERKAISLLLLIGECVSSALLYAQMQVQVTLLSDANQVSLAVCDDGPNFPPDFEPFRVDVTGNTRDLDLIYHIARGTLSGEVRIENRKHGGGRVIVTFPLEP